MLSWKNISNSRGGGQLRIPHGVIGREKFILEKTRLLSLVAFTTESYAMPLQSIVCILQWLLGPAKTHDEWKSNVNVALLSPMWQGLLLFCIYFVEHETQQSHFPAVFQWQPSELGPSVALFKWKMDARFCFSDPKAMQIWQGVGVAMQTNLFFRGGTFCIYSNL